MRRYVTLAFALALAGCGGGGGASGGSVPAPAQPAAPASTAPSVSPQSGYVTPTFTIRIPARTGSAKSRSPKYVSSATLSVQITLTADSVGIDPATLSGNPATTSLPAGTCASGCTVNGPPTPPGTDSFRIVTYDNATPAGGHALNAAQLNNVTITAGQNNAEAVTLGAIPAALSISNVPSYMTAGTQNQTTAISVIATDAAGTTIPTSQSPSVQYVDATGAALSITVTDPDTSQHGSCVIVSAASSCTSGAATSATFASPDDVKTFRYDGLAENPVTLTASATGATNGTATFQPNLNAPAFNASQATPSGVASSATPEIDLFAKTGTGSTGTEAFTESGWTDAPYGHALAATATPACAAGTGLATSLTQIATVAAGTSSTTTGTPFTATAVASPIAGSCPVTIGDGLTLNTTDASATLTVTYTSSSITTNGAKRRN